MKFLRVLLAFVLLGAAFLALSAQRQGYGALAAQSVYLAALALLIIDRVMMVRKERITNGRALIQIGLGILIASLLFSPDFANFARNKSPGLDSAEIVKLAQSPDPTLRTMALEICLQRRIFKECKPALRKASRDDDPVIKRLGETGLRGRSRLRR
jgi:hypothetical protein